ncbi:MAG: hypothetical protein HY717_13075 [Planctomycetes bacterium]|nr:hypothetical protein [Planctomycetota bacterium]
MVAGAIEVIEVLAKRPGQELPPLAEGQLRYVMAENGLFLERRTAMFTTCCRVERCAAGLSQHEEACELLCGPIPRTLVRAMVAFFRAAYEHHGGEAVLLLLFHPLERRFRWLCPSQTVRVYEDWKGRWQAGMDIEYDVPLELPSGFVLFGDAHSHADLPAYASYLDKQEEHFKDGLHIVLGRLQAAHLAWHIDFVIDGKRFPLDPERVFAAGDWPPFGSVPPAWIEQINIKSYTSKKYW